MAKPHVPHHGDSPPPSPDSAAGGGSRGGGGGGPPRKRTAADGADGPGGVASGERWVARVLQDNRPGHDRTTPAAPGPNGEAIHGPAAKIPLKPPNARHKLNSIRPGSPTKEKNTVILPGTEVTTDLADITAGRATWIAESNRYEVNGRSYVVESTGTVFPVSGPGFAYLSRPEYKVLKQLIGAYGDIAAARDALRRDPSIGAADWRAALAVFRHHKSYKGGA